jgi:hypothetical protein
MNSWPEDPRIIDAWNPREYLTYTESAPNCWCTTGNGSENCREPSKTGGWGYYNLADTITSTVLVSRFKDKVNLYLTEMYLIK